MVKYKSHILYDIIDIHIRLFNPLQSYYTYFQEFKMLYIFQFLISETDPPQF